MTTMVGAAHSACSLVAFAGSQSSRLLEQAGEAVFLGIDAGTALFAADLSALTEADAAGLAEAAEFLDLRRFGPLMERGEAALAAYARSALRWHRYSRYCGHCGAPSESRHGGHLRVCTNADCRREIYPRTDPAVIMLVEQRPSDGSPPRCLLANHHRSPKRSYSTLAGFVEPGESLEEAVAREVFEEVGIQLSSVSYRDSQPWPFPASIMLGFRAVAATTDLRIERGEILDAGWFTAAELATFGEWGDSAAVRCLSPRDSIARSLIDSWMQDTAST